MHLVKMTKIKNGTLLLASAVATLLLIMLYGKRVVGNSNLTIPDGLRISVKTSRMGDQ